MLAGQNDNILTRRRQRYLFSYLTQWHKTRKLIESHKITSMNTYGGPRWHNGQGAVLQIARSLVRFQLVSLEFFIDIKSFRSHYGPGVDSASNVNEYQEHFLGVKAASA